ncbi:MAG: glycosyltransferase family 2 protein [Solirubrobacteraceae bacterium]
MISVVIPVKDGGEGLRRCLERLAAQNIAEEVEVVVVDSGSSDGSAALARALGARVHEIAPADFDHGGTRNLGARLARGDVLVFTSQDAYAADAHWLARLTAPLAGERVGGAYGRQVAHSDATPPERYFMDFLYGPTARVQRAAHAGELSMDTTLYSNVCSAMRREVFERFPFVEDIIMSEDQEWSRRVLLAGYELAYVAEAVVRHSHPYTLRQAFRRFFDSGVSAERAYLTGQEPSAAALRRASVRYASGEVRWLWATGQRRWLVYAAAYEGAKFAGLQLGTRWRRLPRPLVLRLTGVPAYWNPPTP